MAGATAGHFSGAPEIDELAIIQIGSVS